MRFEFKFVGKNRISELPPLIQANVLKALEDGMLKAESNAQSKFLSGPRPERLGVVTGLLRRRVAGRAALSSEPGIFAIGTLGVSDVVYARLHEEGGITREHSISAKNVKTLHFFWDKLGKWVFLKKVNHPGTRMPARPYLEYGLKLTLPKIHQLMQAAIDKAYEES